MPAMTDKADVIARVCASLAIGDADQAGRIAREEYAFAPTAMHPLPSRALVRTAGPTSEPRIDTRAIRKSPTPYVLTRLFVRDGFVDRYSGARLVFPGVIHLLRIAMPNEFPAHKNWKLTETHTLYWDLFPTLDHHVSLALGGSHTDDNWITISARANSRKSDRTWDTDAAPLHPPGRIEHWDGLMAWFVRHTTEHPQFLATEYLRKWRAAAERVLREEPYGGSEERGP